MEIQGQLYEGKSFAEIDEGLYFNQPQLCEDEPLFAVMLDLRYRYYLEKGDMDNAAACLNRLVGLLDYMPYAEAEKIAAEGIPQQNFLRMKRRAFGRRIRGLDSFDSTCFRICAYHFAGFDYFRFPEVYRSIEAQEIADFLGTVVKRERCSLSIINPLKEEN